VWKEDSLALHESLLAFPAFFLGPKPIGEVAGVAGEGDDPGIMWLLPLFGKFRPFFLLSAALPAEKSITGKGLRCFRNDPSQPVRRAEIVSGVLAWDSFRLCQRGSGRARKGGVKSSYFTGVFEEGNRLRRSAFWWAGVF
jgi:hypothetical protein